MTITLPFSAQLSEQWLLERTYHAQLWDGRELAVPKLTEAMKQLIDFYIPLSLQSWKSKLAERVTLKKSANFYVPLSTWREISSEEARTLYQQGIPVLLYGEHPWNHLEETPRAWRPNRNMRVIIYGTPEEQPEADSGIDYAVCYLDRKRGLFSNSSWRAWFSSDIATLFEGSDQAITFLMPCVQFPYTTHYTMLAADGYIYDYTSRTQAIQGFQKLQSQEVNNGRTIQTAFPQFCYYHEVTCPSGIYRLEFFGPRMDERGYTIRETVC